MLKAWPLSPAVMNFASLLPEPLDMLATILLCRRGPPLTRCRAVRQHQGTRAAESLSRLGRLASSTTSFRASLRPPTPACGQEMRLTAPTLEALVRHSIPLPRKWDVDLAPSIRQGSALLSRPGTLPGCADPDSVCGVTLTARHLEPTDVPALVDLSLRAWAPVFASLRAQLGDSIFLRLHPDWTAGQAEAVRETCANPDRHVLIAFADDEQPTGFVAIWLNAHHPGMGAVDMIAVDPKHQRQGVARELMRLAADHMRNAGMDIVMVETGGDPGHAPARATYEAVGYTLLPIARYFTLLSP